MNNTIYRRAIDLQLSMYMYIGLLRQNHSDDHMRYTNQSSTEYFHADFEIVVLRQNDELS